VQEKARISEQTVQEITKEMKRLDYAKKHLSKTITALKRLHMLLYAVRQLNYAVRICDPPDYHSAANLVGAVQLLLGHFRGYMESVEKMRMLNEDVENMRMELKEGIVFVFRVAAFGSVKALEMTDGSGVSGGVGIAGVGVDNDNANDKSKQWSEKIMIPLPPSCLKDACHVMEALGQTKQREFMDLFCRDHLEPYVQLFHPMNNTSASTGSSSSSSGGGGASQMTSPIVKPSLKMVVATGEEKEDVSCANPNPASLDQVERRYGWYRRMLRELDEVFPNVFPRHWNMEYYMTCAFLRTSRKHLLLLFSEKEGGGVGDKAVLLRDRDCENVTVLLKALQKTILFEKEMTAWLQRECGAQFQDSGGSGGGGGSGGVEDAPREREDETKRNGGLGGMPQETIGIQSQDGTLWKSSSGSGSREAVDNRMESSNPQTTIEDDAPPVVFLPPLIGMASSAFENFMGPYIALEEQNMEDQLKEAASDSTVDTRGELPVLISSTNLFLYIKNSITRCTTLTKRKTLFSLYRAFQRILKKYSKVLLSKYPSALSGPAAAIGGLGISGLTAGGSSSSGIKDIYRIPKGDETLICHVIDTCEYCTETVEALQDLIIDKIDEKFKSKIDMSAEEEAFHDVTAKGIRVLVSGLVHRTDQAFKGMYNINWSALDVVGEESAYVRAMHTEVQPFVLEVKSILPSSYFRNFCDQFAMFFTTAFFNTITRQKRISESGTQQLLLDVYNLKTLLLRLPVLDKSDPSSPGKSPKAQVGSSIAPAVYTKMVTKQFQHIETLLKLVGTPSNLLLDVFKVQWHEGTASDLQTVMTLKGMKRNDQAAMLEKFGVDPIVAMKSTANINDNLQSLQDRSSDVAAKVNNDLIQMREKVERFRGAFR